MEGVPDEKCALVAELMQVLEMARHLETRMAVLQQQGGGAGGEHQQCRALLSTMRASIDRAVHLAMSCRAEAARPESPPSGGDGSPHSGGSDQAGEFRGRGNATGQCKKRYGVEVCGLHYPYVCARFGLRSYHRTRTQEDAAQVEHPGEGEHRAGREPPGRRPQLEEVRPEGHPRRQVPKVSAPSLPNTTIPFLFTAERAHQRC